MTLWTDGTSTVSARTAAAARRKLSTHGIDCGPVRVDHDAEDYEALPDCACGWRGQGTGRHGAFARGDRCPACGTGLD